MNPILKYPGAKWRLADWIISFMPPHEGYLEPFFGSGAVFFNKTPSRVETINDINGDVVNFFRCVRERPAELADMLAFTPWAREEYDRSVEPSADPLERARKFAVRCSMAYGNMTGGKSGWKHNKGARKGDSPNRQSAKVFRKIPLEIQVAADRLLDVQIERKPALDVIRAFDGPDMLIYADPPYPMQTRTIKTHYQHEMTDADHLALLETLCASDSMILLSGYDCEMYRDMLTGWHMESTQTRAERAAIRTECLWINPAAMERQAQVRMEV